MFKALRQDGRLLGYALEHGSHFFFFGSRHVTREDLPRLFPSYAFRFLKQVHGRRVIPATTELEEADGHFTAAPGHALIVQSADCLPILLAGSKGVAALHAGWRGVAQNIVAASQEHIAPAVAAIGPHIGAASFQVASDVNEILQHCCPGGETMSHALKDGKFLFDLKAAARAQLRSAFASPLTVFEQTNDTFTDADFNSHRRDRLTAGRNLSFVVIKP